MPANTFALYLCLICVLAALHLERRAFYREEVLLDQDTEQQFLYRRKRDQLSEIVLESHRMAGDVMKKKERWVSPGFVMLLPCDRQGGVRKLEIVRPIRTSYFPRSGEGLSAFCGVRFDDRTESDEREGERM